MHLLNVARLADRLREGALSEKDKLGYVVAMVVVARLFGSASGLVLQTPRGAAMTVLQLAIALAGVWCCFAANERGDGRSFIERYICIGVPLWIWWAGAYYAAYFVGYAFASSIGESSVQRWYRGYSVLAIACLSPLYYVALARYVARAAGADAVREGG